MAPEPSKPSCAMETDGEPPSEEWDEAKGGPALADYDEEV